MRDPVKFSALVRPAIDRVYVGMRTAARDRSRAVVAEIGTRPGFITDLYFGLLARPIPVDVVAAAAIYGDQDTSAELATGVAVIGEDGSWHLTALGRRLGLGLQQSIGDATEELSAHPPIATMPGLAALPELAELLGRLLDAGSGPVFSALVPVYEPPDASAALQVSTRLGALRHHRADAHRAAWMGAGLTVEELLALPPESDRRRAIEDETNQRDAAIYRTFSDDDAWHFLSTLAAL